MTILTKKKIVKGLKNPRFVVRYFARELGFEVKPYKPILHSMNSTMNNNPRTLINSKPPATQRQKAVAINQIMGNPYMDCYPLVVYFSGTLNNWYQLETWFTAFRELINHHRMVFVVRDSKVFKKFIDETDFPVIHCVTINDLLNLYEQSDFKCILYVNNAVKNFQSLINRKVLHIHINHGDSDKLSMITNQANAYDYVYIVAEAARQRYEDNLLRKDMSRFVSIGRPQLENLAPFTLEQLEMMHSEAMHTANSEKTIKDVSYDFSNKKIILYAPTWEGTHESMNYCSIASFGVNLVKKLLANDDYFVIYKPHPNTGSREAHINDANNKIIELIKNSKNGIYLPNFDIIRLYPLVSLAIFDNSSVTIDYLTVNKPMLISDMFDRLLGRVDTPRILDGARLINANDITDITNIIENEIKKDSYKKSRNSIKKFYLGDFDYQNGESTNTFIKQITSAIAERDELIHRQYAKEVTKVRKLNP